MTAPDGLRLHLREYGTRSAPGLPVVCLPGLARTAADFDDLAPALAAGPPERHVIAIDSRGRGHSDHDTDHSNYNCLVELGDIISVLISLGIGPAVFVGSSRGGVLTMMMATIYPTAIAGAVLHDVGPVTEAKGFARIKSYLGKLPHPRTYRGRRRHPARSLLSAQFPKLTAEQWLGASKRTWHFKHGTLKPAFDIGIASALSGIDVERPLAALWREFDALHSVPLLVVRGENSDILSAATVDGHARTPRRRNGLRSKSPTRAMRLCSRANWCGRSSASRRNAKPHAQAPSAKPGHVSGSYKAFTSRLCNSAGRAGSGSSARSNTLPASR